MTAVIRWTIALLLAALLAAAVAHRLGHPVLPPRWNPWAPIDLTAGPNLLTRFKLNRLAGDGAACRAALAATALAFTPVPDRATGPGCGFRDAVRVTGSDVRFGSAFTATCPLAAAWALFETHVLQPAALRRFGQPVVRVRHLGSYACRNLYGRAAGRRSQHATANALDVAGFTLADGTAVTLAADWDGAEVKAAFLRDLRDGACGLFDTVLGPDYNAAHRDHFHLDMGPARVCR
ncbi:extensin-like domain-containing protein [Azospirillum sp. ST 5-10]|uniref:extensin-like domain-containing protein n=1 Tax=unclassified Azospirillum TaxID=2630922 RepID=UPI003F49D547